MNTFCIMGRPGKQEHPVEFRYEGGLVGTGSWRAEMKFWLFCPIRLIFNLFVGENPQGRQTLRVFCGEVNRPVGSETKINAAASQY